MHWKTFAASAFAVSILPTASANIKFGCWSDSGVKFHQNCVVALTSLLQRLSRADHGDWVDVPTSISSYQYYNCRAEIKSDGRTVATGTLLTSFDQLAARCQNGWFYYDNGWLNANIQGVAGWKRDEHDNKTVPDLDFTKNSIFEWEDPTSPESFPLPEGFPKTPTEVGGNNEREHARDLTIRDLTTRALTFGQLIQSRRLRNRVLRLFRGTGFTQNDQHPISYVITMSFPRVISNMVNTAASSFSRDIINGGIAQPDGSTVDAIAIAAQLNTGLFSSWTNLFSTISAGGDDAQDAIGLMMADSLQDLLKYGYVGAVYHVYDEHDDLILSFILNGVTGTTSRLPSS